MLNDADRKAFTELLPSARFTPLVAGWDEAAQKTIDALQKIYLGAGEPNATLKAAAEEIDGILHK